jgi:hypothetical protein
VNIFPECKFLSVMLLSFFESYEHTRTAVCTWIVAFNVQDIDFPWEPRALAPDFKNYLSVFKGTDLSAFQAQKNVGINFTEAIER